MSKYEPLIVDCNSKLRRDKAIAVVQAMVTTMRTFPDDAMFGLKFRIKELTKQKQQNLVVQSSEKAGDKP